MFVIIGEYLGVSADAVFSAIGVVFTVVPWCIKRRIEERELRRFRTKADKFLLGVVKSRDITDADQAIVGYLEKGLDSVADILIDKRVEELVMLDIELNEGDLMSRFENLPDPEEE